MWAAVTIDVPWLVGIVCHRTPVVTYLRRATHHKPEASLEVDVSDATVAFEEPLHVLLPGRGAESADENTTPAHLEAVGSSSSTHGHAYKPSEQHNAHRANR